MKTKIQLVSQAFDELRINGITANADSEDIVLALESQEQLVSELTFDIGWRFEPEPDPNTVTGIPMWAESAIYLSLAVRIADRYGKQISPMKADAAMGRLIGRVKKPRLVNYPANMPAGLGNRRQYRSIDIYMPQVVEAPNDVNTETMSFGDVRPVSIDFTDVLQPSEVIQSYTKEPSEGLTITDDSFTDNVITFTVQADDVAYQFVIFKVTGDLGTVVNRRIDFSVAGSESIRGNP